jgi:hypothetical protein
MGSSFSFEGDVIVPREKPLVLRYRYFIHGGDGDPARLDAEWRRFSQN